MSARSHKYQYPQPRKDAPQAEATPEPETTPDPPADPPADPAPDPGEEELLG